MIEFGLDRFAGIDDLEVSWGINTMRGPGSCSDCHGYSNSQGERSMLGSKPCMQFIGDVFETSEEHKKMKSLVLGEWALLAFLVVFVLVFYNAVNCCYIVAAAGICRCVPRPRCVAS